MRPHFVGNDSGAILGQRRDKWALICLSCCHPWFKTWHGQETDRHGWVAGDRPCLMLTSSTCMSLPSMHNSLPFSVPRQTSPPPTIWWTKTGMGRQDRHAHGHSRSRAAQVGSPFSATLARQRGWDFSSPRLPLNPPFSLLSPAGNGAHQPLLSCRELAILRILL